MTTDPSDKKTFDMYHFISRKDTLAAAVVIVVLLFWLAHHFFVVNHTV